MPVNFLIPVKHSLHLFPTLGGGNELMSRLTNIALLLEVVIL